MPQQIDAPYAAVGDVSNLLGAAAGRLPSWVVVDDFLAVAHATAVDALAATYPAGVPTFAGASLEAVRWAEAKLAAAEILSAVRVNLPDLGDAPDRLRTEGLDVLAGGVVGHSPGGGDLDGDPGTTGDTYGPGPRVSSFTGLSAFPDPYAAARGTVFDPETHPAVVFNDSAATAAFLEGLDG